MTKKRITVDVEEEDYLKLRAQLVLKGKTFTSWLKEVISKMLNE